MPRTSAVSVPCARARTGARHSANTTTPAEPKSVFATLIPSGCRTGEGTISEGLLISNLLQSDPIPTPALLGNGSKQVNVMSYSLHLPTDLCQGLLLPPASSSFLVLDSPWRTSSGRQSEPE